MAWYISTLWERDAALFSQSLKRKSQEAACLILQKGALLFVWESTQKIQENWVLYFSLSSRKKGSRFRKNGQKWRVKIIRQENVNKMEWYT